MLNSRGKMTRIRGLCVILFLICHIFCGCQCAPALGGSKSKSNDMQAAKEWLKSYNVKATEIYNRGAIASWNYDTNLTEYNKNISVQVELEESAFEKEAARNASIFDWKNFNDTALKRQFEFVTDIGISALNDTSKIEKISHVKAEMEGLYSKGKVCYKSANNCLELEPGLTRLMATSRDYDELLRAWKGWRDASGKKMKDLYMQFVNISNEGIAALGGYNDTGAWWRSSYESDTFEDDLVDLLTKLQPLYKELHTYVRTKLQAVYQNHTFPKTGHIPAHLLGNMWAQDWTNIYDILKPYDLNSSIDVTSQLKAKNYSIHRMFTTAEDFYTSLGLLKMPETFWNNSMLEKPSDRDVVCHASAWDFSDAKDFRIKMCTDITMEDLVTIHHEMGHIQYYLQYKDQPILFRGGANPGFHEAVGDVMALSVATPEHLHKIGLLKTVERTHEGDINFLMRQALDKVSFLPFGYLIDQWRWSVFRGDTPPEQYNTKWWQLRCKYQGISPPDERTENDFDPGAKYHIPANTPYIRYFVSFVIQFQFHQALCKAANHIGPLYTCDIYKSKEAGKLLGNMLKMGDSKPWPEAMQAITGQRKMDTGAILEYFDPLLTWLKEQNKGQRSGWTDACPSSRSGLVGDINAAKDYLKLYNDLAQDVFYRQGEADWNYNTNLTDYNQEISVNMSLEVAQFQKEAQFNASLFDFESFKEEDVKRQFEKIIDIGTSAMKDKEKLGKLRKVQSDMEGIYSKANVCLSDGQCMQIEPGLTKLFANSKNYTELTEAWEKWRDATGRLMKTKYEDLVDLSNLAVSELGYKDTGDYWRSSYETPTFQQDLQHLLEELAPLYQNLHAYVKRKLIEIYGQEHFPDSGHIPAHLLGNMWAQQWTDIYEDVQPYKGKQSVDVTPKLVELNYNATDLFHISEEFFTSLGLLEMPDLFWKFSMITKPADRNVVCHASAWDFYNQKDFRIKMCTTVTMEDLITIHHEMGHIQYYLQYKDQPVPFREGANHGFHEAVGDVMALSVSTPEHLHKLNLLDKVDNDSESDLNFLMNMALQKIAFLPFGYLIDQWRWSVFGGETTPEDYNNKWWELRCKYQGLSPPVTRSADDFDPGAKFHIPANVPYIRYFVSFVIQFQFHQALCNAAGQSNVPLHRCDIYQSKEAGKLLGDMLKMGSSKPWPEAMFAITGQKQMKVDSLMEYFKPLTDWLKKQNEGHDIGWTDRCPTPKNTNIDDAKQWLTEYNTMAQSAYYEEMEAEWAYGSNITDYNQQKEVEARLKLAKFKKEAAGNASLFDWTNFNNETVKRLFRKISDIGTDAMKDESKLARMNTLQSDIEGIYAKATVSFSDGESLALEPGLTQLMARSRNYTKLQEAWLGWRDNTGKLMHDKYADFVTLSNEGVSSLGYHDTGEYWRSWYESPTFESDLQKLLEELKPLYSNLHAYVRDKLMDLYGRDKFPTSGHIPAHLLGNMWAQQWNNIYDLVIPYPDKTSVDVTPELKKQGYRPLRMFETAEEFFHSLGLLRMPERFWNKSIIVKPTGRKMVCHASAEDFYNQKDFRIKMCTDITMEDLVTIHHEMGHIEYFLQYKDQPVPFRDGANPGFHEAVGDTLALSVATPKHLKTIGLLHQVENDEESDINYLLSMALDKIAFLPFGYLIDQWRWSVFSGKTPKEKFNDKWWELRCKYQGVSPPVERTSSDFDPGAKFHIPSNTPYIRYFVSFVVQFQFHKALCKAAGQTGPLHKCDIYRSTQAGTKLGNMLRLGSSKPWPYAMEALTGQRNMSAQALMDYFAPLTKWLEKQNAGKQVGWEATCSSQRHAPLSANLQQAQKWLTEYNVAAQKVYYEESEVEWTYATNITDYNQQKQTEARLKLADFEKEAAANASKFDWKNFNDEQVKRQFSKISDIGTSALTDKNKLKKLNDLQSEIEGIYGKGKVCLGGNKCLKLDPDLYDILTSSRNYTELTLVWQEWRNATGKKMKDKYEEFVRLSNEGVRELGYNDTGEYWRSVYDTPTFQQDLQELMEQLKPLYEQLHAYVRKKLKTVYGAEHFPASGHIPAHLLGNMWAQEWQNLYDLMEPYKNKTNVDVTPELNKQNYTAHRMFKTAEEFFTSLGLKAMPGTFWNKSMIVRPAGRDVICHASAWDFYNQKDFRIKMCTNIKMEDLITIHHEMGHIQYYLQYKDQPVPFREGGNPGFHEAVGDVLALSVSTPKHLNTIKLLDRVEDDHESDINFLMKTALEKIAFLPFGYLIDQWRWDVFSGKTTAQDYNNRWWELRCKHQGISPPVARGTDDFDPGAKYHIPSNTPYIRYFVSFVVQFQFHQALCKAAGQTGPLHKCDIYRSKEAGQLLGNMLRMGSSRPWPDAMAAITGQRKMDVSAIVEYFKPLIDWLKIQNEGELIGWQDQCMNFDRSFTMEDVNQFLEEFNTEYEREMRTLSLAEWAYSTNITAETTAAKTAAGLVMADFRKRKSSSAARFDINGVHNATARKQLKLVREIGVYAMRNKTQLAHLVDIQSDMESIYSKGKVCFTDNNCQQLEPGLTKTMAESRNYDTLLTAWKKWRDVTGKKMKPQYVEFVYLSNKAINELGYHDLGAYWRSSYDTPTFQQDLVGLLEQLKPLYENLHTYIRRKLMDLYGSDKFPTAGHIPAHLLGNMWAQDWSNIYDIVAPYKNKPTLDVTAEMVRQNYTVERMFRTAEDFFKSLGMEPLFQTFWDNSMLTKPEGRDAVCHASAWDMYNQRDYRIKMCTVPTMESLIVIHHEMGHTQYQMQYRNQTTLFRDGANAGFHEAIGDVIALSVTTPKHLRKIGLLNTMEDDAEADLNFLMKMALEKIAFLPFGYLIDQWRWSIFSRDTLPSHFNEKWWELRCKYQGVSPPVTRTENDFDPGAKYHIPANYPYIRYFVSYVIQFQFHKSLCEAAGHVGPLHTCDIYNSKGAGKRLSGMLKLGMSKPWPEAMEKLTGQRNMDVRPLLEYFKPLIRWLEEKNKNERPGWTPVCPKFSKSVTNLQHHQVRDNNKNSSNHMQIGIILLIFLSVLSFTSKKL